MKHRLESEDSDKFDEVFGPEFVAQKRVQMEKWSIEASIKKYVIAGGVDNNYIRSLHLRIAL